jgi:hypothetical protein
MLQVMSSIEHATTLERAKSSGRYLLDRTVPSDCQNSSSIKFSGSRAYIGDLRAIRDFKLAPTMKRNSASIVTNEQSTEIA